MPPPNLLAPAFVFRCAPLAMTRTSPCERPKSVRICDVSLYSNFRRQMHRSGTMDIARIIGLLRRAIDRVGADDSHRLKLRDAPSPCYTSAGLEARIRP